MAPASRQLAALSQEQYEETFATLIATFDDRDAMHSLIKPVIEKLNGKAVRLLSIGAGTGAFEDTLVTVHGLKLKYYHAFEPSKVHYAKLKATVAKWHVEHNLTEDEFHPHLDISDGYDLILMAHVMYNMADPLAVMKKARSLLAPGGSVIIFNHTQESAELQQFVKQRASLSPQAANESLAVTMLSDQLHSAGITGYRLTQHPSTTDIHDFVVKNKQVATADHVVSFFMQTPFKDLDEPLQSEVYNLIKNRCKIGEDNRYKLHLPCGMLEIFSD